MLGTARECVRDCENAGNTQRNHIPPVPVPSAISLGEDLME